MPPTGLLSGILWRLQKADIWSSGVILYALLYGRYPFNAKEKDYAKNIVTANYAMPEDVPVSASCKELLSHVLVADPAQVGLWVLVGHTNQPGPSGMEGVKPICTVIFAVLHAQHGQAS